MSTSSTHWLLGSNNRKKAKEMSAILHQFGVAVRTLEDREIHTEVDEWGTNFLQNAVLKALGYGVLSGDVCIADDSGLAVDALNGAPGVYSSRYAGPHATDDENNRALQQALQDVPMNARGCAYHCVIAIAAPNNSLDVRIQRLQEQRPPDLYRGLSALATGGWTFGPEDTEALTTVRAPWNVWLFQGTWDGHVALESRGEGGFGYDPWVILPDGRHVAELPDAEKNQCSHRAQALQQLQQVLHEV